MGIKEVVGDIVVVYVPGVGKVEVHNPDTGVGLPNVGDVWIAQALYQCRWVGEQSDEAVVFDPSEMEQLLHIQHNS